MSQTNTNSWTSTSWGLGALFGGFVTYTVDSNHHAYISINFGLQTPSGKFGAITHGKLDNDGLPVGPNDVGNLLTSWSDTLSLSGPGVGSDKILSPNGLTATDYSLGTMIPGMGAYFGYGIKLW